jgi:hypothetical protein
MRCSCLRWSQEAPKASDLGDQLGHMAMLICVSLNIPCIRCDHVQHGLAAGSAGHGRQTRLLAATHHRTGCTSSATRKLRQSSRGQNQRGWAPRATVLGIERTGFQRSRNRSRTRVARESHRQPHPNQGQFPKRRARPKTQTASGSTFLRPKVDREWTTTAHSVVKNGRSASSR